MEKYGELLGTLLEKRGIKNEVEAEKFLNPDYEKDSNDPFLMKDMERACVRLFEAIDADEKVMIYADYDCDGIPGAVILVDLFKKINFKNYEVYIPMRNSEGYGLNMEAIKECAQKNIKLLITIDLGVTALEEVKEAEVHGIDVIITDHHLPHEILPRAYAILNPKQEEDKYPEKMLCGAGVMFKFIQGFIKKYGEFYKIKNGIEKWMLDMVGLATLSDMVPLVGENRLLAFYGLKVLRKSRRVGLQKLLAKMNLDQRYLAEDDIGFMVTPKLNAASRMDDPLRAFELLSTDDVVEAGTLTTHLLKINDDRKLIVAGIMREVKKKFEKREMRDVIVVGNPIWKVGVLGLVAGKLIDEYQKPVFVWGKDENDLIKGSCRSPGSVSIVELMTETREYFIDFGGHELAGGFTVQDEKIHFLEERLAESFVKISEGRGKRSFLEEEQSDGKGETLKSDLILTLDQVNIKNWRELEKLAPYGIGNPKPIFLFKGVTVENIKKFGKNGSEEHLEITFSDGGKSKVKGVSFFSGDESFDVPVVVNGKVNLLATFDLSRFRGREELRLRIVEIF